MNTKKIKKQIKEFFGYLLFGGFLGLIVSFMSIKYIKIEDDKEWIFMLLIFPFLILSVQLQIIFHEFGHLLFGLLTGYQFVSIRIGSIIWVKRGEKLVRGRYKLKGTGGQCIMLPPELKNGSLPYVLYNLGGVLVNLFTTICIAFFINIVTNPYVSFFFLTLFITGIYVAITNGIPLRISGMANDGYNIRSIHKNPIVKRSYYVVLKTNALQVKGMKIGELPYEWFLLPEDADLDNPLNASVRILEGNWYFDKLQFDEAKTCYETVLNCPMTINLLRQELLCELLYFELVSSQREEKIDELLTKELKRYIQATKNMINKQKLRYAYSIVVENNLEKAEEIYKNAWENKAYHCIKGEALTELEALKWTKKTLLTKLENKAIS